MQSERSIGYKFDDAVRAWMPLTWMTVPTKIFLPARVDMKDFIELTYRNVPSAHEVQRLLEGVLPLVQHSTGQVLAVAAKDVDGYVQYVATAVQAMDTLVTLPLAVCAEGTRLPLSNRCLLIRTVGSFMGASLGQIEIAIRRGDATWAVASMFLKVFRCTCLEEWEALSSAQKLNDCVLLRLCALPMCLRFRCVWLWIESLDASVFVWRVCCWHRYRLRVDLAKAWQHLQRLSLSWVSTRVCVLSCMWYITTVISFAQGC